MFYTVVFNTAIKINAFFCKLVYNTIMPGQRKRGKKFVGVWLEEQDALALGRKLDDTKKRDDKVSQSSVVNEALRSRLLQEGFYTKTEIDDEPDHRRIDQLLDEADCLTGPERKQLKKAAKERGCETVTDLLNALASPKSVTVKWEEPDHPRSLRLKLSESILRKTINKPKPPNG